MASNRSQLRFVLQIKSETRCSLKVELQASYDDWEIEAASQLHSQRVPVKHEQHQLLLECLEFPESFDCEFKASPKSECISFRYMQKNEKFCFQIDLQNSFECYMCYMMMWRAGVLHPQWKNMHNFEMMDSLNFEITTKPKQQWPLVEKCDPVDSQETQIETIQTIDLNQGQEGKNDGIENTALIATCQEIVEGDLFQLFQPSQPIFSEKYTAKDSSIVPTIDLDDENLFTPLSFQEFGYNLIIKK